MTLYALSTLLSEACPPFEFSKSGPASSTVHVEMLPSEEDVYGVVLMNVILFVSDLCSLSLSFD